MDMQISGGDRSGKLVYVALAVAVIGLVAGIVGAARGIAAGNALNELSGRLPAIERKITETADGAQNLSGQMNGFVTRANDTLTSFGRRIMTLETDVKRHEDKLAAPPPPPAGRTPAGRTDGPVTASGKVHEVKSGDTLERIAKAHNVSLADLLKLNPQVDPTRMRIGMKIALP